MKVINKFSIILIMFVIIIGCNDKNNEVKNVESEKTKDEIVRLSDQSIKEIKLAIEVISLKQITGYLTIPARVIANQDNEAQIGSLVQGRVQQVLVKMGDYVKAGQTLMYIEGLEIGEIKADYLKSKSNYDLAKANLERQKLLLEQNVGAKRSYYEAESEFQKSYAEFQAADKKIHSIGLSDDDIINGKNNLAKEHTAGSLAIKSPINGIVIERNVVIGQLVDGTTNAFRIVNTSSVWIDGQAHEKDISKIKSLSKVQFSSSTYPKEKFDGRLTYIGQVIDDKTRTITIRAEFNNTNNKLKPQMFGDLIIPISNIEKGILVPSESIIKINNVDYVFVQKGPNEFEKRQVTLGINQNDFVEVKTGLKENEKIVITGAFYLKSELLKDELGGDE